MCRVIEGENGSHVSGGEPIKKILSGWWGGPPGLLEVLSLLVYCGQYTSVAAYKGKEGKISGGRICTLQGPASVDQFVRTEVMFGFQRWKRMSGLPMVDFAWTEPKVGI